MVRPTVTTLRAHRPPALHERVTHPVTGLSLRTLTVLRALSWHRNPCYTTVPASYKKNLTVQVSPTNCKNWEVIRRPLRTPLFAAAWQGLHRSPPTEKPSARGARSCSCCLASTWPGSGGTCAQGGEKRRTPGATQRARAPFPQPHALDQKRKAD